jgi:Carbohydrate esterase, sialic acid-specific acetylesterase
MPRRPFRIVLALVAGLTSCSSKAPSTGGPGGPGADGSADDAALPGDGAPAGDGLDAGDPNAIDVYLIGGQSNATGQGYMANLPTGFVPDPRVLLYSSGPPHLDSGSTPNAWVPLRQASESPDRFGPELGFGNHIQELYPDRRIAIIKHAHTGTSLYADWAPGADASDAAGFGPQFQVFVATVTPALQGLRDMGLHPVIRAMLWQQGEADADRGGTVAQQYGQNLGAFIARVRAQWAAPAMLFVYGYVYPPPNVGAGRDLVRQAEHDVDQDSGNALAVPQAFVVATDDLEQRAADPNTPLPNDHIHFGTAGQLELGRRMADKVGATLPP